MDETSSDNLIEERKKKFLNLVKLKYDYISYAILALIVFIALRIRTRNLAGLRDISTGGWTLGPDLDPFLFLRWAKYIVANGSIMVYDTMRYVPLGFDTREELLLLPYMIAWFHKVAVIFGSTSVDQSAVFFPVFMFGLTVIAFFLFVRKVFIDKYGSISANIIALISSLFLSVIPSLLPRTIAGIPEKESAAFFFMFITFYFFLSSWKSKSKTSSYFFALLCGITTAMMALVWGGYTYIFITLGLVVAVAFILEQITLRRYISYIIWILSASIIMYVVSARYTPSNLITSFTTGIAFGVLMIIGVHFLIFNTSAKKYFEKFSKVPKPIISLVLASVIGAILLFALYGFDFFSHTFQSILSNLVSPITDRLGVTVAENRQPFFPEWSSSFGPVVKGIPILFWLFFIGSIYLYTSLVSGFKKNEKIILVSSYVIFLISLIFSRYTPESALNGTSMLSLLVYAIGFIFLIFSVGYYYYKYHKSGDTKTLHDIDLGLILVFSLFFLSIVSARGAVRLIMVLVPPASIVIAYFIVALYNDLTKVKDSTMKVIVWIVFGVVIISTVFSAYQYYLSSTYIAQSYAPTDYTRQWQKAMSWTRENTPKDAVFAHWWDYGYWVQSMGERATVLDGGNAISYWDYLMGRYALTGKSDKEALEFHYSHNTTHLLIDSTDIGKYSAFSSIGSDENYDRFSWIVGFTRDPQQVQETKNATLSVYTGGTVLDEDIYYTINGTQIFLPAEKAGIGGIIVERDVSGNIIKQPEGVFVYQNNQYRLPLRYSFEDKFVDYGSGVEAGIFVLPNILQTGSSYSIDKAGAVLYLSNRTVKSQLAKYYLYKESSANFKLVHSEDDFLVADLKSRDPSLKNDFVYVGGVRGPIRIWEIKYPSDVKIKPEYLSTQYPNKLLQKAR